MADVAKELVGALELWGAVEPAEAAITSSRGVACRYSSTSDNSNDDITAPSESQLMKATWPYHIILDVTSKLQDELGIGIVVYI